MKFFADDWLGRDLTLYRADRVGTIRSTITITAYDPEKGWRLIGAGFSAAWITSEMLEDLLMAGVLEEA